MKNNLKYYISGLLILLIFGSFNTNPSKISWNLEKSKNGILVYSSIPEGQKIKQIKVKTTAKTTLSAAIAVLKEVENYTSWIYSCNASRLINKKNELEMIYYSETSTPWPLQNRDLVVYNKIAQDKTTKKVQSISTPLPNKIPEKENLVRVTDFYGEWTFTPINENEINIEYYLRIDPAGNIPAWMLNMFIDVGPYQTLEKFKQLVELPQYKNAKFDYIKN